ncbi:AAA family ATPase [Baia soyae]|uniref:Pilus assembly protein CpaE n=1 Tax=Baia soyae TaxID=1544746 RepID=A0A4R2S1Y1_9BACL|nr:AAA family ATPase [Baia soyae]TCP69242.1 pilus assembly protein CpaE [Baia soyae]
MKDLSLVIVTEEYMVAEDLTHRMKNVFSSVTPIPPGEVRREISRLEPDIVILHESQGQSLVQLIPYIKKEVKKTEILYLTDIKDSARIRDASRVGAFDILFFPDEINVLEDAVTRAIKALQSEGHEKEAVHNSAWGRGQIITLYSGKGGVGKSLIASTLAQTLQLDSDSGVLLIDLNLQYGGIDTYLNVESERNIYDLTPVLKELNDNHIRNVTIIEPKSQMSVLPSPANVEINEQITEEHVERLLRTARLYYDFIIVDLPSELNTLSYIALEESDKIFYVLNPDLVSLRTMNRVIGAFGTIGVDPTDRLEIILNRTSRNTEISAKEVKKRFPYEVIAELPDDPKALHNYINRGQTIRSGGKEKRLIPLARQIQKLAKVVLTYKGTSSVEETKKRK